MTIPLPRPKKFWGQHFLTHTPSIQKITQNPLILENYDAIIEIGPGRGAITDILVTKKCPLLLIDIDQECCDYLQQKYPETPIMQADILSLNLEDVLQNFFQFLKLSHPLKIWAISNLPYNISVPITRQFLNTPCIQEMRLMYQKEVALKFIKQKKNSSLYHLFNCYYDITSLFDLPPSFFSPQPQITSSVLNFCKKETPLLSWEKKESFEKFLRHLFSSKRKTLQNMLKGLNPTWAYLALEQLKLTGKERAEDLPQNEIIMLYNHYDSFHQNHFSK